MADASKWKSSGRISLWRYTQNERHYPGWHISADAAGRKCLLELLERVGSHDAPYHTVALTAPTRDQLGVPNNGGGDAAWVAAARLCVRLDVDAARWTFPADLDPAMIAIGSHWLEPLRRGIRDMAAGRGDYSIGDRQGGSLPLWFWW